MAFLDEIVDRKRAEVAAAKKLRDLNALKRMIADAPAIRSFSGALTKGFGLIAEIKRRSPSGRDMRKENVEQAPAAYAKSPVVKCVSVLTNSTDFGMGIEDLSKMKTQIPKPILRKDFIFEEYQVYEARAFGAKLYGINSRKFKASAQTFANSTKSSDFTVELETFSLINHLPKNAIKIAESGVSPSQLSEVVKFGYDAVLVGTSLLKSEHGIEEMLKKFESALTDGTRGTAPTT